MATAEQTVIRVDKGDGSRSTVTRRHALDNLSAPYRDCHALLDAATEANPAQTPFALYWPVPPTVAAAERTAGESIANAVSSFHFGRITLGDLAKAIDDALRVYR